MCPTQVLRPGTLAALAGLTGPQHAGGSAVAAAASSAGEAGAVRVARYALRRCDAVLCLLHRLATIPEMIESARATGLTLVHVRRWNEGASKYPLQRLLLFAFYPVLLLVHIHAA